MTKGYIHVYTGNGKGKTTAALGLALRAVGAGKKVFFAQFVKGQVYSEVKAVQDFLPAITIKQYGLECFIRRDPVQADIDVALRGVKEVAGIIASGMYDIVIFDEANIALYYNLFTVDEFIRLLKQKPSETEVVITGRYAPQEIIDMADLVTEMQEVKHYFQQGVLAREGIEC